MADFTALKTAIQNAIKQNGNNAITGNLLQDILISMVSTLGDSAINGLVSSLSTETTNRQNADGTLQSAINTINTKLSDGYTYLGIATSTTNPSTTSGKVFYIATTAGTYTNFHNSSSQPLVLTQGINILKYNGTSWSVEQVWGVDDVPTAVSNNLVKSGGVQNELALGAVYDVSAKNPTEGPNNDGKWESLSALLSDANLNTLIPTSVRKGGMSIKYVCSSDNKYVQFRYMGTSTAVADFTNVANWQGVDDEPTVGSDNLVKSGGVADALGSYKVLTSASSVHNGYDTSGNPKGTLDTYFYSVSEGDVLKINYNVFSSGFSVVQAWNDNTFVASVLNSPLTGEGSIFYKVPAGVNKVGCTYFQNNVYLYVPTLTFEDRPTENSHKLLDSGAIFKSSVFCGSIDPATPNLINSFDLQQGLWYVPSNNPNMPFPYMGFVQNQGIEGLKQQIAITLYTAEIYIRVSNNSSWGNWKKVNYSYYQRSLIPSDNIDILYNEGVYYITFYPGGRNTPQGILPITGSYDGLLVVNGTGSISQQTIFVFGSNDIYVRSSNSSYSNWERIVKEGDLSSLVTTEQLSSAVQTLIDNYLEKTELKGADSNITGLFKPDGTPAASTIKTYFYNVDEGDVLKIIYGTFSSGFSIVQAWNGDTFVESLLDSPTTGSENILNYTVPQGVTKVGCSYFTDNVYLVKKVTDDLYEKIDDTNERIDKLSKGTRNLWNFAETDISYDSYIILGTVGVKLIDAGTYRLSFELNVENSTLGVEFVGYYLGGGQFGILHQQRSTNGRLTVTFTAVSDIDRLFFSFYSTQEGNTAQFTNIQLEILDWNGYTSSPQKGDWAALPYATPFVKPDSLNDIISREIISYWNGKTINYNGDSVTQGVGGDRTGWVKVVNQILKFGKVNNYAIGGTRLAHVEDEPNCMVDRYTDMSLDCDILMIMANTNDYASQVPIGNVDSVNPNEYNGALNIIFSWIKANFKTQPIIISTMLTRKVNYDEQGNPLPITIEQYAEAVRERTAAYGFILYDAYKLSGLDLLNSVRDGSGITNDGLHPNEAGALALGRKIAAFINAQ